MQRFGHVVILEGGKARERSVSLVSGAAFGRALTELGIAHERIDTADGDWIERLARLRPDVVLNGLHGPLGEDGAVQGVLECLGLAYTHSGVCASAIAMNKEQTKRVARALGIDVPDGVLVEPEALTDTPPIVMPLVVKPNEDGSSYGVAIIHDADQWRAHRASLTESTTLLIEEYIPGRELTVAVMGSRGALGVTEIVTNETFYDYHAKYAAGGSSHVVNPVLPEGVAKKAMLVSEALYAALGCRGLARADFRFDDAKGRLSLLEVNTQPGMTPTSLAPEQAAHCGIAFNALVAWMLEDASCRR
jgi:D-alanine-D-alanine ligase